MPASYASTFPRPICRGRDGPGRSRHIQRSPRAGGSGEDGRIPPRRRRGLGEGPPRARLASPVLRRHTRSRLRAGGAAARFLEEGAFDYLGGESPGWGERAAAYFRAFISLNRRFAGVFTSSRSATKTWCILSPTSSTNWIGGPIHLHQQLRRHVRLRSRRTRRQAFLRPLQRGRRGGRQGLGARAFTGWSRDRRSAPSSSTKGAASIARPRTSRCACGASPAAESVRAT